MIGIMRTTLSIDDALLSRAKKRAADRGVTLGAFLDDALRAYLVEKPETAAVVDLPSFEAGGVLPGVDVSSNRALYDLLDEDEPVSR
jgi:hypothetical protein